MAEKELKIEHHDDVVESSSGSDIHKAEVSGTDVTIESEWTFDDESRIRRRMDMRLIPVIFLLYLLCFIDRANVGNARIQGMEDNLALIGDRFNYALTIFYISYILVEVPSNIIIKIVGAKVYLPSLVVAFGVVSMCTAFVHNYEGLLACRFFLGIAEGGMMPGAAYYLSCFYRRHELLFRVNLFITGATLAGAFGGLLAAGLTQIPRWGIDSAQPIHTWRNIFFFEGVLTILFAFSVIIYLPNTPDKCKFLSPRDQYIALERINREHKETTAEKIRPYHVYRAIFNINNVLCALGFFFVNVSVQSISLFLPSILNALGWTAIRSQLYSVPPYVTACAWSIFIAWVSDVCKFRGYFIILGNSIAIVGYSILVSTNSDTLRYLGVFLAACGAFPLGPFYLSWGLNNAAGPSIRAVTGAYIVALGTGGAILATWTYRVSDKPAYRKGHAMNLGTNVASMCIAIITILYVKWENRKRAAGKRDWRLEGLTEEEKDQLGYRHPEFRYTE